MSKIPIEVVTEVLTENELPQDQVLKITRQLNRAADKLAAEAEAEREPQAKKQFVILVSDPDGVLHDELVGWVCQLEENENPGVLVDRIKKAAYDHNVSRRGRKHPVKSIAESCEVVGGKIMKEHKVWIKTKLPVTVLTTDNVLPRDDGSKIGMDDLRIRSVLP